MSETDEELREIKLSLGITISKIERDLIDLKNDLAAIEAKIQQRKLPVKGNVSSRTKEKVNGNET